jgi:hypothetical protein
MITKVCSSSLYNIGSLDCEKNNPFLDAVSLFLSVNHEFATFADFADEDKWKDEVAAGTIIPLHGIVEIEDQSEEPRYYEAPNGTRVARGLGKYRHTYLFNLTFEQHKALQSYHSADLDIFVLDDAGNISGYSPDGEKVKGMDLGMFNPEKMRTAGQDNTPAWSPVVVDQADAKQWNEKGVFVNPGWLPSEILPVADVELSVADASATSILVKVAYVAGIASDGSDNEVGVSGIVEEDFEFTDTSPDDMVDNGDGTYTFTGTDMVAGSVDLKVPADQASGGQPIKSTGPATIEIT